MFLQRTPLTHYPADKYITSRIRIFIMLALPRITRHSGLGDARSFMRIVWLSYKLLIVNHKVYHHFILALRWQTVGRVKWLFKLLLVFDVEYVVMISNWPSITYCGMGITTYSFIICALKVSPRSFLHSGVSHSPLLMLDIWSWVGKRLKRSKQN